VQERPNGVVEESKHALVLTIEQHAKYMLLLPRGAQVEAKKSRVAFPLTAKGKTDDGAGSYGRQFRDKDDKPTTRDKPWFLELMDKYANQLDQSSTVMAEAMRIAKQKLAAADVPKLVAEGAGKDELDALLNFLVPFMTSELVGAMHAAAHELYEILVKMDEKVGVTSSKIYDAKLVISAIARRAVEHKGAPLTYADFGLNGDGRTIANSKRLLEIMCVMMSLHRPPKQRHKCETPDEESHVRRVLSALTQLAPYKNVLMLVDTGTDPNEDDVAAIMLVVNYNLLVTNNIEFL